MDECIKACNRCQKTLGPSHACFYCCYDCESVCKFVKNNILHNSMLEMMALNLCIKSCELCIEECGKHIEHHEVCRQCIVACTNCIDVCNDLKMKF